MELTYAGSTYHRQHDESVLDCLIRHNVKVKNSCRAGLCQSCMLQRSPSEGDLKAGENTGLFQKGLSRPLVDQGYFLACQSFPKHDIDIIDSQSARAEHEVLVIDKVTPNRHVCILKLKSAEGMKPFSFRGGQFVNLWKDREIIRSYSIASADNADIIELHIRRYDQGKLSAWVYEALELGQKLTLQGPLGTCYYSEDCKRHPLQLFAMGTGLAPIMGVLRTALKENHSAPITLVFGARESANFYMLDELAELAKRHRKLQVTVIALEGRLPAIENINAVNTDFYSYAAAKDALDCDAKIFICGGESFVAKLRKRCYMGGANLADIRADSFLQAG